MIKKLLIASFLLLILINSILIHVEERKQPGIVSSTKKIFPAFSKETPDNPDARIEYEMKRLVDPKTGKIPRNMRALELAFASDLPKSFTTQSGKTNSNASKWIPRGPYNVGGRTRGLAMDINDENILLAGGVSGGMWRSEDQGKSWIQTTDASQLHSVTCIVQDTRPGKTEIWYHGTGEREGNSAGAWWEGNYFLGDGIFKSTDGGKSWAQLASTISNTPSEQETNGFDIIWKILVDHSVTDKDVLLVAVENGIYRTEDGGNTWSGVLGLDSTTTLDYCDMEMTSDGVFYAAISKGKDKGYWRSSDGETWTEITPSGFPNSYERTVMGIAPSNENIVYFLTESPGSGNREHNFWKYTYLQGDGAGSDGDWDDRSQNLPEGSCTGFFSFEFGSYSSQTSYDMYVKVKPDNADIVFLGGTNVYRSLDGFESGINYEWIGGYYCDPVNPSNYIYPNHHPDQHNLIFIPSDPDKMISASDGGVAITNDNMASTVDWESLNNGYVTSQFYTVSIEEGDANSDMIVGGLQDNGTWFTNSTDDSELWKSVLYGDGSYCAIANGRKSYYFSWQSGKTFKFQVSDSGVVEGLTRIDPSGTSNYLFINPFILDANDNRIMYIAAGSRIWRNDNLDEMPITNDEYTSIDTNWVKLKGSLAGGGSISALGMAKGDTSTLYYGTTGGRVFRLDTANTGDNDNVEITDNNLFPDANVSCITADPSNDSNVIVVFSNYKVVSIFYSEDKGNNWKSISGNLEENLDGSGNGPSVNWVGILPLADSTVYFAGTSVGMYSTVKLNGDSTIWTQQGGDVVGNVVVHMVKTRMYDSLVVVGTHGNGIFSFSFEQEKSDSDSVTIPQNFAIKSIYPNPMISSKTTIEYEIPTATNVEINVIDYSGRKVAELVNSYHVPNVYQTQWNGDSFGGSKLPQGVYIVQLKTGDVNATQKVILLNLN